MKIGQLFRKTRGFGVSGHVPTAPAGFLSLGPTGTGCAAPAAGQLIAFQSHTLRWVCRPRPAPHPALPVMISPPVHSLLNRLCKVRLWLFYLPFEFLQQYVERENTTPLNSPAYLLLFLYLFVFAMETLPLLS